MASEPITSPLVDLLRQYKLLQEEFEFEKETFYQQTQRAGIPKRIQQGVCWYPVSAYKSYYNSLNQLVVEIKRDENDDTDHNFEYGRPVCFFRFDGTGNLRYFSFAATISYVHENTMLVVLPHSNSLLDIQGTTDLGVQLYFDGTSYKTMFSALTEVMEAKNNRLAHLREVILGNEMAEQRKLQPIHLTWLNRSQEQAVNRVLATKEVAVVHGPPGTGKTLLAKAVAGEANVPFFSISGSEFVEMFVGAGAAKVRDLFKQANEKAPCIVFIDEIDTIGKKRDGGGFSGNDEREQTLNQLLTEMDGFSSNNGVLILAATNRPESLDPALLRPGRFDRRVPVELPDLNGRIAILKVHAQKVKLGDNVDFAAIARMAAGASGAELANMVNEAALSAVRAGRRFVTQTDLEESVEVVIAGYQKKDRILSDREKMIVSYHEIGHALVAARQTNSAPVTKITIIPRTSGALGYTMQVDQGEHNLLSKEELENKIATFCGGRAAEEIIFNSITTGASNDIEQATKLARACITRYGMSEDFDMVALETVTNQYLGGDTSLACSEHTAAEIDRLVVAMVKKEHAKACDILRSNIGKLHELAKFLYEKETITGDEFMAILDGDV